MRRLTERCGNTADNEFAEMGPGRRPSLYPTRPAQKRTLENEYNIHQNRGSTAVARSDAKKQRTFTTPHSATLKSLDTNDTPSCSKPPISSSAQGRSVLVTESKPAYTNNENFEVDYYDKIKNEYQQQKVDSGAAQTIKEREEIFRNSIRTEVFNRIKFILKEADLDFGGPVYKCMAGKLKLEEEKGVDIEQYWNVHRPMVRETLNNKRGTINGMMKEAFNSKSGGKVVGCIYIYNRLTS